MSKIKVIFNESDMEMLDEAKEHKNFLYKDFEYTDSKGNVIPGDITINPQKVISDGKVLKDKFLKVNLRIYSYDNMIHSHYLGVSDYIVEPKNVEKLLFGEHIIVNQIDGERVIISVSQI